VKTETAIRSVEAPDETNSITSKGKNGGFLSQTATIRRRNIGLSHDHVQGNQMQRDQQPTGDQQAA